MVNKQLIYILISLFFAITACEQKHFYNEYKAVNTKAWNVIDTLTYIADIDDANAYYDILVSVRYQKDYEFSNLWLNIINSYSDSIQPVRLEVPLFKKDGKPYGKVSGSLCTQTIPFQSKIKFPKAGKYRIKIVHLMRKDPLDGISDVGVIIDKR
jgi:gliding motility-associated lipoprotein GldH